MLLPSFKFNSLDSGIWNLSFCRVYDDGGGDAGGSGDGDVGGEGDPSGGGAQKSFTKEEVDKLLAEQSKKLSAQRQELAQKLAILHETGQLSAKEKEELAKTIDNLRAESQSKEELAKKEQERIRKDYEKRLQEASTERDSWRNRFETQLVMSELVSEASKADAYNPQQVVTILRPNTSVVEEIEGDKPTGRFSVRVKHQSGGKEIQIPVDEAIKLMKEDLEGYGNLFKDLQQSGTGRYSGSNSGKGDSLIEAAKSGDHAAYLRIRNANKKGK